MNYKEIYEEMKHGTVSDCNLVAIIDYFKYKSEEQLVNQIVYCQAINRSENKENVIQVEGADIYSEYIIVFIATPAVGVSVQGVQVPGGLDTEETVHILQNVDVGKEDENGTKLADNMTKCVKNVSNNCENVMQNDVKRCENGMEKEDDDNEQFLLYKNQDDI